MYGPTTRDTLSAAHWQLQYFTWQQRQQQLQLELHQQNHHQQILFQQQQQPMQHEQRELHNQHQQQQQQVLRYAIESEQMARYYSPWSMPFPGLSYPQQMWAHGGPRADDLVRRYSNRSSDSSNNNSSHSTSLVSSNNSGAGSDDGQKESDKVRHSDKGSVTARVTLGTATQSGESLQPQLASG